MDIATTRLTRPRGPSQRKYIVGLDTPEPWGFVVELLVNRPGVEGAVLQTALFLTDSFTQPFPPNIVVYGTMLLRLLIIVKLRATV